MSAIVTVLMGAPGAGKTTWVTRNRTDEFLADTHPVRTVTDINVDHYMATMRWQTLAQIKQGRNVIIDATNTYKHHRLLWLAAAEQHASATHLVAFDTSLPLLLAAQKIRQHPVPQKIVLKHYRLMQKALQDIETEKWHKITIMKR